jgi:hypothetical protein
MKQQASELRDLFPAVFSAGKEIIFLREASLFFHFDRFLI